MCQKPFALRIACVTAENEDEASYRDILSDQDSLPAVVDVSVSGYAIARDTLLTDIKTETTDDK